ncbi:MAG: zf-HC2 domain-containing protein [Desulfobacteraceae bacterium]|nr:zf-HC2 domain-containing protein [Desulfobacteraceae bacterium]MCB9494705.1 zf-HC2 domain-containing protein [Desulfobacteraceae bacterium]
MTDNEKYSNHCIQMFEVYSQYLDGELDENQRTEVEHHIETCSECRACFMTLKKTKELCSKMPRVKAPDDFTSRLHSRIRNILDCK